MGLLTVALPEVRHDRLAFHTSMAHSGLLPDPDAPAAFADWLEETLEMWPFENLATAHNGLLRGDARRPARGRVRELLAAKRPALEALAAKRRAEAAARAPGTPTQLPAGERERLQSGAWAADFSEENCECG